MSLIVGYQNRGLSRDITILDVDEAAITPGDSDKVRVTIGREGETPKLSVTSGTATANGSSVTTGVTNRMRLDASDLGFSPGVYSMWVDFYDAADATEWKCVEQQSLVLLET